MNVYLNNLNKMINKANRIKKEDIKCEYVNEVVAYALFCYYSGYIKEVDFNSSISKLFMDSCLTMYINERNNSISELIMNNNLLNDFYRKTLLAYQNYVLEPKEVFNMNKDINKYFIEFLKYMNCYNLYHEMESKKRITYETNVPITSICIGNKNNSYIVLNENNLVFRYLALVHELAHALENKILKKRRQYFDSPFQTEIISIMFNRIFVEYLKNNNALTNDEVSVITTNFEVNCKRFIEWTYIITEAVRGKNFLINDYDINMCIDNRNVNRSLTDHNYSLGSIFSLSLLNMWRKNDRVFIQDLPNMIYYLDKLNLKELVDLFSKYDTLEKELDKALIKK